LRNPFTKDDFYEFIEERGKTIILFIKNTIINQTIELPADLKILNDEIEKIELKIRDILGEKITLELYKQIVTPATKEKVDFRIQGAIKKNPSFSINDFIAVRNKLDYFDLQEYCEVMVSKNGWEIFEPTFKNKTQLQNKFSQLGELRNSIRHSRGATEVCILEGKASIAWFKSLI
jgi:hypothetical protein